MKQQDADALCKAIQILIQSLEDDGHEVVVSTVNGRSIVYIGGTP